MCGIVGIVGADALRHVAEMNSRQFHRGPDDQGVWHEDTARIALAMRRLSIVDIAGGHQPMVDPSGRYVIVYNGEVINAPALRQGLQRDGVVFRSDHSDTEVLLNLYIREGRSCVAKLNGMFAFAIYDSYEKSLFLARDPSGIKPLYYFDHAGTFAFASELKSLRALPMAPDGIDRVSLHDYLTLQFVPAPRSIYAGINKLPAGHMLMFYLDGRRCQVERYWAPAFAGNDGQEFNRAETTVRLRSILERAASDWMLSDVEVGASLSGGIDSAALVGLIASQGGRTLKTWTLGFEDSGTEGRAIDERALAARVAARWGTDHHEVVIKAGSLLEDLDEMVDQLDEPYGGGLPSWYVFKAMSRDVKVGIVGTGGDELFGNYGKWRVLQPGTLPWLKQLYRRLGATGLADCLRSPHGALYPGYFGEREKGDLYRDGTPRLRSTAGLLESLWNACQSRDPKNAVACVDMQMQLPEEFLMMTDRFSMRWSLEARPPLLDQRVVEFALGLAPDIRSPDGRLKGLLIDAVRDLLPDEVVAARKKGFVLPVAAWLRQELRPIVEHYLGRQFLRDQGIFREDLFDVLARPHMDEKIDASQRLWTLLMFQMWWDRQGGLAH